MTNREYLAQYPQIADDGNLDGVIRDHLGQYDPGHDWRDDECRPDDQFLFDCLAMADVIKAHVTAVHGRFRPAVNRHFPAEDPCYKDIRLASDKAVTDVVEYRRSTDGAHVPADAVQDAAYRSLVRYVCALIPAI